MINTKIKNVYDVFFCDPEEIAEFDNGNEILKECDGMDKIPIRLLQFPNNHENVYFMLVAGEGALYPWKRGQEVETSYISSYLSVLKYLREMRVDGIDNSKYQCFCLYDTIIPINSGESFPEKDAKRYKGLFSYDLFKGLADDYYKEDYREDWIFI